MRILVVEDDHDFADILRRGLTEQSYTVESCHDGESGLHRGSTEQFDLILLDVMLPRLDGFAVCKRLRDAGVKTPIIMLTARDDTDDRILGLDMGADDYLPKPFSMGEMFARIRAVVRRARGIEPDVLSVDSLTLDRRRNILRIGERETELTAKEFCLMEYFMLHPETILTRTEILENVWDSNYGGISNVVDVYVNYLRNKLEEKGEPRSIVTIRGRGYMLTTADA